MSIHNPSIKEETIGRSNKVLSILDESDKIGVLVHVIEQMKQNKRIIDLSAQFLLFFNTPIVTVSEFRTLDGYYRYVRRSLITLLVDTETNYNISVKSH